MPSTEIYETEAQMFLCEVPRKVEITLDSESIHPNFRDIQKMKKKSDARSAEWSDFLFARECQVEYGNESRWYKVLQHFRPRKSLYSGLKLFNAEKVKMTEACVQTDDSYLSSRTLLKDEVMTSLPTKPDQRGGFWGRVFCCCRQ
ncbi:uncharacterized protein LOC110462828 [Mizuhopecten yessoensis]|uniref:Uncharacterized protein n=1 Tax=Mizuhopecten yessoensis TaxID=6573 RepID=A0A210PXL6_MIZYE|nr:uncharacterized protein LOC110462828 [Mizuhopecten yessoensis]OWF41212.1 hypothetical protein KP79_PYT09854 [Mizuhopecten yessoensis]